LDDLKFEETQNVNTLRNQTSMKKLIGKDGRYTTSSYGSFILGGGKGEEIGKTRKKMVLSVSCIRTR
jgi:hypothetical protein